MLSEADFREGLAASSPMLPTASRGRALLVGFAAVVLAACVTSSPSPVATSEPVAQDQQETGAGPATPPADPKLSKVMTFGAVRPVPVEKILRDIARVYWGDRIVIAGPIEATFQGELKDLAVRDVLDQLCQIAACSWRLEGEPPQLTIDTN